RAVIIRVPLRIKIVVPPRKASVERPSFPGFLAIDLCVVVRVGAFKNLLATAENRKAVHHLRIFPRGHVFIQSEENLLIQSHASRAGGCPTFGWPEGFISWRRRCLSGEE